MHTIHDKKIVLDCGTAVATTSRIISGFGRSSLRRKPNTTSEELRAAVESTRPARNLEIYLWSRVLLDQRPGGTSPLFYNILYQILIYFVRFHLIYWFYWISSQKLSNGAKHCLILHFELRNDIDIIIFL